ncbi:MAG: glycerophosphodiester phosphodiesterase family protein [Clostridia bacterium]|nr:glycerophosphodiester phosphodiesterase family protein [Clostridia bacterium]
MNIKKKLLYIFTLGVLILLTAFSSSAMSMTMPIADIVSDNQGRILSVSYRGDTAFYPGNSVEGVLSAWQKGADMVSVSVRKTKDNVYVLCEDESLGNVCNAPYEDIGEATFEEIRSYYLYDNTGELTEYKMSSLQELLANTDLRLYLILDIEWEDRDSIYELLKKENAHQRVALRTKQSARKISQWCETKADKISVIGIYDGNIIWNSISHINKLSEAGMTLVQYQSKNYFNVMYGSWTTDNFSAEGKARALAPAYNPDLCGQRSDSESGWNELISKGFTVIETNNVEALAQYIEKNMEVRSNLSSLLEKAKAVDTARFSITSKENLSDAIEKAEAVLHGRIKSLDEAENAYSKLIFYMNEMKISDGEETTKGALNITAGKIIATVTVGAAIFLAQVFVHKQHRKKKDK